MDPNRCALCHEPAAPEAMDHIDLPAGSVPACLRCLGELNDAADAHRDAARDHMEAHSVDSGLYVAMAFDMTTAPALPWERAWTPARAAEVA